MSILNNSNIRAGASANQNQAYNIQRSLRFRGSATGYLSKTFSSAPTSRNKYTLSFWTKISPAGASGYQHFLTSHYDGNNYELIRILPSGQLEYQEYVTGSTVCQLVTSAVYRDYAGWYHIVLAVDTTNATAANRNLLYVNGKQITSFATQTNHGLNDPLVIGYSNTHHIGNWAGTGTYPMDGYMADVNFVDGQTLTPASFGESDTVTGVWKPKRYTGSYGTNGFKLDFSDNSAATAAAIGKDSSGNGNNWTPNNISVTAGATYDSMTDVPTLTSATASNYAVANPLNKNSDVVVTDGNLRISLGSVSGGIRKTNASIALPVTGKYYWETKNVGTTNVNIFCGIQSLTANMSVSATGDLFYNEAGEIQNNGSSSGTIYGSLTTNDILGMAYDADANKLYFYKNNVLQNSSGTTPSFSGPYIPFFGMYLTYNGQEINFGQRPFTYTPPSGFKALNTFNLPTPAIPAGNKVMDATTYTGNAASPRAITNSAGFKPDLVWIKSRSSTNWHKFSDSVRGPNYALYTNDTGPEDTNPIYGKISAFNSNGFSVANGTNNTAEDVNGSGTSYVAWQWQAGQGVNSTNTSGSLTSTVSANPSAGFSIVSWTGNGTNGATVGHGLGVKPAFVIIRNRNITANWPTLSEPMLGSNGYVYINSTAAKGTATELVAPTSSVLILPSYGDCNGSGQQMMAYCWSEVAGFSKFGSYTGNGSADGPFVYTGFRPAFVLVKRTDTAGYPWIIFDKSRDGYNVNNHQLYPNSSGAEDAGGSGAQFIDLLSSGFKFRNTAADKNASGGTYIYMAFAEVPFKTSLAR